MSSPCHFALFGLTPSFALDLNQLAVRYRELAREVHPDRFSDASDQDKRRVLEQSAAVNEAYQVLRSAPARARYLLSLQGGEVPLEVTVQDPEFLIQQMQWREELEELHEAADASALTGFKQRLKAAQLALNDTFDQCWQDPAERAQAERLMRRMQFLEKLNYEVRQLEERLDD